MVIPFRNTGLLDWFWGEKKIEWLAFRGKELVFLTEEDIMRSSSREPNAHFLNFQKLEKYKGCAVCRSPLMQKYAVYCPVCDKAFCLDCIVIKDVYADLDEKVTERKESYAFGSGTWVGRDWFCPTCKNILRKWRTL